MFKKPLCSPPTLWPWKARLKRLIGGWLWPQATQRWQQYCTQHPILKGIAARAPNLLVKIYRPYFIQQLSCQQRVDALINHYEMNRELKLDDLLRAALNQSISIAQLVTKSGYSLEIVLKQWGHNGFREGEYGLALLWQGREVFVMDCIFAGDLDKPYFVCSRFQACETGSSGKDIYRLITKELFGTRPINFMLHIAQTLAFYWGFSKVGLLQDRQRVSLNWRRRRKIKAQHEAVWRESGAVMGRHGFFELEAQARREVDLAQVPSRKRAEYQRKIDLLHEISRQIQNFVEQGC